MTSTSSASAPLFSFPNPVNEVAARVTAGGVVLLGVVAIVFQLPWLTIAIAVGFLLRVAAGPKLSPLALLSTRVIVPRLPLRAKLVPGPPKRFAQTIGLVFSTTSALLALVLGLETAAWIVLAALVVAASLEAFAGICLGCQAFALLIRLGVIPEEVCEACNDIWGGRRAPAP